LFIPVSLLPFAYAKILHFFVLSACIAYAVIYISNFIHRTYFPDLGAKFITRTQYLLMLICLLQFYFELHLGNLNIILLLLVVLSLAAMINGNHLMAGILMALAIFLKPHFVLLLPVLVLRKQYRTLLYFSLAVLLFLVLPALFIGISKNISLHQGWLGTMLHHNKAPIKGFDTIYSLIFRIYSDYVDYIPGRWFTGTIFATVYSACCLLILTNRFSEKKKASMTDPQQNMVFEYLLVLALIPNLMVTDFEHFMFSAPLIAFMLMYLYSQKDKVLLLVLTVLSFLLYGGNLREVVGTSVSSWMTGHGMLGLGNLVIISLSVYIFLLSSRKKQPSNY
jgi:hypothetical protein